MKESKALRLAREESLKLLEHIKLLLILEEHTHLEVLVEGLQLSDGMVVNGARGTKAPVRLPV